MQYMGPVTQPLAHPSAGSEDARPTQVEPAPPAASGTVLVVAVHRAYRESVKRKLLARGVVAIGTSSELNALELVGKGNLFDAVLVDAQSDRTLDLCLLGQIQKHCSALPIVLSLPGDAAESETRDFASGVFRCVSRTSHVDTISDALCEAVASSRTSRSRR